LKKIILYSYLKCSTCRKAAKWLESKYLEFQLIDLVKEPPLVNYLNLALEQFSDDKKKIFNTRGKAFKTLDIDIYSLSREEIIQLLLSDGKLVKRPFLIYEGKKVILGFNEIEYAKQFISG
jgi:arsenate reductase